MFLPFVFAVLLADPDLRPIPLESLSIDRARVLDGRLVTVSFLVARPPYTLLGRTMVGAAERDDGAERGAVLVGKRLDVEMGQRLTVRGRLRVIEHRGGVTNGVIVPDWTELRIEEARL